MKLTILEIRLENSIARNMINAIPTIVQIIVSTFFPKEYPCVIIIPKNIRIPHQMNAIMLIVEIVTLSFSVRKLEIIVERMMRNGMGAIA